MTLHGKTISVDSPAARYNTRLEWSVTCVLRPEIVMEGEKEQVYSDLPLRRRIYIT